MTAGCLEKRSMRINGHRTSVAIEPRFWNVIEAMAEARSLSIPKLMAEIDKARASQGSLASAVRCAALDYAEQRKAA